MRKSRQKTKEGFFAVLSRKCSSLSGLLVFSLLVLNLFVVYLFEKSRQPQIIYSVERIFVNSNFNSNVSISTTNSYKTISNISQLVKDSPSSNIVQTYSVPSNTVRATVFYDYFTYDMHRYAIIFDRRFSEGSLTSYGRISTIFPDRILLEDGSYLYNAKYSYITTHNNNSNNRKD